MFTESPVNADGLVLFQNEAFEKSIPAFTGPEMIAIRNRAQKDPYVAEFVDKFKALTQSETPLKKALLNPQSGESKFFNSYLRYLAYRGTTHRSSVKTGDSRSLGFSTFESEDFTDRLVGRLVDLGEPFSEKMNQNLMSIIHGAASRIDTRSNTFMMNDKLMDLHEVQDAIMGPRPLTMKEMEGHIEKFMTFDGSAGMIGIRPMNSTTALALTSPAGILSVEESKSLAHVRTEIPSYDRGVEAMTLAVENMDPKSPQYPSKVQALRSYVNLGIYHANEIKRASGALDALAEGIAQIGDQHLNERFAKHLALGIDGINQSLMSEFRTEASVRELLVKLYHLAATREKWNPSTLEFVLDELEKIATLPKGKKLELKDYNLAMNQIKKIRLEEVPDLTNLEIFLKGDQATAKIRVGMFNAEFEKVPGVTSGKSGIRVKNVRATQKYDAFGGRDEFWELEELLSKKLSDAGFQTLEFHNLSHLHLGREFDRRTQYRLVRYEAPKSHTDQQNYIKKLEALTSDPFHEVDAFLNMDAQSGGVHVKQYTAGLKKSGFGDSKKLSVRSISAKPPGQGGYQDFLSELEKRARQSGYSQIGVEGVDNPRQFSFYEDKMGYSQTYNSDPKVRDYEGDLSKTIEERLAGRPKPVPQEQTKVVPPENTCINEPGIIGMVKAAFLKKLRR